MERLGSLCGILSMGQPNQISRRAYYQSEIGWLELTADHTGITAINFLDTAPIEDSGDLPSDLQSCVLQLEEYFQGNRKTFDLPLNPLTRNVWSILRLD